MMKPKLLLLLMMAFAVATSFADDKTTFKASAPDVVAVDKQFRVSFTINAQNATDFISPSFTGLEVLMGPSRSQSTQIIHGKQTNSITFSYIVIARKVGIYSIPQAIVLSDNKLFYSNSLQIQVALPEALEQLKENKKRQSEGVSESEFFVTTNISKKQLYENEASILTYKIYTKVEVDSIISVNFPDFNEFRVYHIDLKDQKWALEHVNGENYHTCILSQYVLSPIQTGEIRIRPTAMEISLRKKYTNSEDAFSAFFGDSYKPVKKAVAFPGCVINVRELPNKPADFTGMVGDFGIVSSVSRKEIPVNDGINFNIKIFGTGNLPIHVIKQPTLSENLEIYEPTTKENMKIIDDKTEVSKEINYFIIARKSGVYTIPSITFVYYDISIGQYRKLNTPSYTIKVNPRN